MSCRFEPDPCPENLVGQYTCRRCQTCGHAITVPAAVPESGLLVAIEHIKANCPHNPDNQAAATGQTTSADAVNDPTAGLPDPFAAPAPPPGPGTYLKKYLSRIGITSTPTCSCNAKARHMDEMGVEWCEANLTTIIGWLKEEAERRNLPFFEWPAKLLIQKAIKSAKKAKEAQ
jgi:hypothetical protein